MKEVKPSIVVHVRGGVVQQVVSNTENINIKIFDVDMLKDDEGITGDKIDEMWNNILDKHQHTI